MRFILGRVGTGKTTLCMNEIKKEIESGFDKPIIYIVPEQFSFEAEKKLIEISGKSGIMGAQVLSFKRLAYKVFNENNVVINFLNSSGSSMLLYFIMTKLEKDLKLLKGASKNPGVVNIVLEEISEFKRYNLSPSDFENIDFKNEYLNMKIHDLSLIYKEYSKYIEKTYVDENDSLTILAEVIKNKDTFLNGAKIWIDEFDGFIPQELSIIMELNKKCDVTISMISDDEELFELNNINISKIKKMLSEEASEEILTKPLKYNSKEIAHLEKNIYKYPIQKYVSETKDITISSFNNLHDEIDCVAKQILNLVQNDETKYSNIAILTRDTDTYKNIFKLIFPLYHIPFFIDDKKSLSQEPLMTLILSFFDIVSKNYSYESVFTYLKTGLSNIENDEDIDLIENYILKWGIHGKKWEEDFTIDDDHLDRINEIRKEIVAPIINFKNDFAGRKTAKDIAASLFTFLKEINVFDRINNIIAGLSKSQSSIRIAMEYSQVWNMCMQLLDDIVAVIGDEQISFEKFKATLKVGISNHEISVIPTTKDQVMIGDIERTRSSSIKYLFIVGVNDGSFPKTFSTEGFINDKERSILLENGIEIAKDTKMLLKQEMFNIYKALSTPTDKLYISFPTSDLEGNTKRQAFLINQIKTLFPSVKSIEPSNVFSKNASFAPMLEKQRSKKDNESIDEVWEYVANWYKENESQKYESVIKGLDYKNTVEAQSKDIAKKLYGENMYGSVSKLESYVLCPFSFYLRYGLKLRDRDVFKLGIPDVGSLLHEIIDAFSKKVIEENINLKNISKEECDDIVSNISDNLFENFRHNLFSSTGKLRGLSLKLKEQIKKMIWLIVFHINSGNFNIMGSEVEFGVGKEYPEIVIELNDKEKLTLNGKVDRIDIAKLDDGNYIRIVDYKSSNKAIKLSNVYYGVQLQLLSYVEAISNKDLKPAGAFYLHLDDPIYKFPKKLSKEDVENNIINALRMNGIVVANAKLIEAMDEDFASKEKIATESEVLNLKKSREGVLSKMPVVSEEQFAQLRNHMKKTLKEIGQEIMSGNIKNEPLIRKQASSPCSYCDYSKVCLFERELGNKVRRINELKDEEVLEKISSE